MLTDSETTDLVNTVHSLPNDDACRVSHFVIHILSHSIWRMQDFDAERERPVGMGTLAVICCTQGPRDPTGPVDKCSE